MWAQLIFDKTIDSRKRHNYEVRLLHNIVYSSEALNNYNQPVLLQVQ